MKMYNIGDIVRSDTVRDIKEGLRLCQIVDVKEVSGKDWYRVNYWHRGQWLYGGGRWRRPTLLKTLDNERDEDL
jgi:hypothetical protein